jgi:myo-inositol catabolism protein IolC
MQIVACKAYYHPAAPRRLRLCQAQAAVVITTGPGE